MKRKFKSLVIGLVLLLGLTACGERESVETDNLPVSQLQQTEQQSEVPEQLQVIEQESSEPVKQESEAVAESTVWVPDEFVLNNTTEIDFVAPAVHTGNGEPCTFMWEYTEADLQNWFLEQYGHYNSQVKEYVGNYEKIDKSQKRLYTISKSDSETQEWVSMTVETGIYNENVVYSVSFDMTSPNQAVVIEETKTVLGMLGLENYAEDIIHNESLLIDIPTENDKGKYSVSSGYRVSEYSQTYSIRVSVGYRDSEYTQYFWGYKPVNFEYWEDYFSLEDYLTNSEFDTSSVAAFTEEEKAYIEELYDNTYDEEISLEQSFVYNRYDFEKIDDVEFKYLARCKDGKGESGGVTIEHAMKGDDIEFQLYTFGRPLFENRSQEFRGISMGEDLSDAEIQELSEARHKLMKKLDSNIDWTVEDLVKQFRDYELGEDSDKTYFEGDGYRYTIFNDLSGLSLHGNFEGKEN